MISVPVQEGRTHAREPMEVGGGGSGISKNCGVDQLREDLPRQRDQLAQRLRGIAYAFVKRLVSIY